MSQVKKNKYISIKLNKNHKIKPYSPYPESRNPNKDFKIKTLKKNKINTQNRNK